MPPASNEEQFKFLISCIRYSNNGKVDFGEVARECGIVTKGAAADTCPIDSSAKRYERMMKAHGILPGGSPVNTPSTSSAPKTSSKSTSSKKRKTKHFDDNPNVAVDDDDDLLPAKEEDVKPQIIKDEETGYSQVHDGNEEIQPSVTGSILINDSDPATGNLLGSDDSAAIGEFFKVEECASGSAQGLSEGLYDGPVHQNSTPERNSGMMLQESIVIAD